MEKKLTIKQERFAQEYVSLGNASAAYRKVYDAEDMTDEAIHVSASRVKAKVWLRIQELQKSEAEQYQISRAEIMKQWIQIIKADVNDLVQVRRKSCANCYLDGNKPQPNPGCQKCLGEGDAYIYIADTRNLSTEARLLYAGAKKMRDGVEIVLRDKDVALTNIARALKMFSASEEKAVSVGLTLNGVIDPNEAARIYQKIMSG